MGVESVSVAVALSHADTLEMCHSHTRVLLVSLTSLDLPVACLRVVGSSVCNSRLTSPDLPVAAKIGYRRVDCVERWSLWDSVTNKR